MLCMRQSLVWNKLPEYVCSLGLPPTLEKCTLEAEADQPSSNLEAAVPGEAGGSITVYACMCREAGSLCACHVHSFCSLKLAVLQRRPGPRHFGLALKYSLTASAGLSWPNSQLAQLPSQPVREEKSGEADWLMTISYYISVRLFCFCLCAYFSTRNVHWEREALLCLYVHAKYIENVML